jgi:hypothetical protein
MEAALMEVALVWWEGTKKKKWAHQAMEFQ